MRVRVIFFFAFAMLTISAFSQTRTRVLPIDGLNYHLTYFAEDVKKSVEVPVEIWSFKEGAIRKNEGWVEGKLLHGDYKVYLNGNLLESGRFQKGVQSGTWRKWDEFGNLLALTTFKNGEKHGAYMMYADDEVSEIGKYKKGKKHGVVRRKVGEDWTEERYKKGQRIEVAEKAPKVKKVTFKKSENKEIPSAEEEK